MYIHIVYMSHRCALSRQGDIWDKIDGEIEGTLDVSSRKKIRSSEYLLSVCIFMMI